MPAACRQPAPAIATAIASSHMRMRRQSPKLTTSVIAPIVQKLDALRDGAEHERERERAPDDGRGKVRGILHRPDYKHWSDSASVPMPRRLQQSGIGDDFPGSRLRSQLLLTPIAGGGR